MTIKKVPKVTGGPKVIRIFNFRYFKLHTLLTFFATFIILTE